MIPQRTVFLLLLTASTVVAFTAIRHYQKRTRTLLTMMKNLPDGVVKYSQVPKTGCFTANTIPKGLLKEHTTKAGTWGRICVARGKLHYQINQPQLVDYELDPQTPGIIEPQIKHQVAPLTPDVEFVVEFYRYPHTGPVDEKREGL